MNIALILAGGRGTRMGASIPKQFIQYNDKPILIHTLEAFASHSGIDEICLICPKESIDFTNHMLSKYNIPKIGWIAAGGATRRESSLIGICRLMENHSENDVVLIHDAARPNVSERIITDNITSASEHGACETVVCACDTIAVSEDGKKIKSIPDRSTLYNVQTPQSFRLGLIYKAHMALINKLKNTLNDLSNPPDCTYSEGSLISENLNSITDDASLILRSGGDVFIVEGDRLNIKITTEEDLRILCSIMA